MQLKMIVACINAEGAPDFHTCQVEVSEQQQKDGEHYLMAYENAKWNGFAEGMVAYESGDISRGKLADLAEWIGDVRQSAQESAAELKLERGSVLGSGNTLFLVSGRVPEDDDDTAYLIRAASEEDASAHFRAEVTEYESPEKLDALEKSHGTDCFINLCQKVGVFTEPDVNDRSVNALRDEGYAVVVFNPDELESADPTDVCDRLIELGWDVIDALSFEEDNASA